LLYQLSYFGPRGYGKAILVYFGRSVKWKIVVEATRGLYKLSAPGYNFNMRSENIQAGLPGCCQRQHDLVAYLNRFSGL